MTAARWEGGDVKRDFAGAADILANSPLTGVSYLTGGLTPKSFLRGMHRGGSETIRPARRELRSGAPEFEKAVQESPDAADRHANLGLLYAFMGRRDEAIREGRRAVELKPISKDANDGAIMLCYLALIYARVGENDQAIPLIERLLKTPGAVDSVNYSITLNDLKYRWEWDPLRKDPRFRSSIAKDAAVTK